MTKRPFIIIMLAAAGAAGTASAAQEGPVAASPHMVAAPVGMTILAPAAHVACTDRGVAIRVAARWSRAAIDRPVRSVRVLLQRPGSEAVIDSVVLAPARPTTTRRATLRAAACRDNLDLRYELFLGRVDRPHDHTSVTFRTHAGGGVAGRVQIVVDAYERGLISPAS